MKRFAIVVTVIAAMGLSSVALAAGGLRGSYKRKIHSSVLHGALNGTWTITFLKSGAYRVLFDGKGAVHGKFSIKGDKVTLTGGTGPDACGGPGTYSFTLKGNKVTLTKVKDQRPSCAGRVLVLAGTFTKTG